jgi:hypothetical protein
MSIFEQATKSALRFKATNGMVSTEDLWGLGLAHLDMIAKALRKELRDNEDSFIDSAKSNTGLELKFEVVKHIIASKIADRDAQVAQRDKAARKQQILGILEQKKSDSLQNMSVEALEAELKNL